MNWKTIALAGVLATSLATIGAVNSALAGWGCDMPYSTSAPGDQAKIDGIRQKYDADRTSLEANLRATSRDLDQALIDKDSAKTEELRQKLYGLEREYSTVHDRARAEMRQAGVGRDWGSGGWSCRWHDDPIRARGASYEGRWDTRGAGRC